MLNRFLYILMLLSLSHAQDTMIPVKLDFNGNGTLSEIKLPFPYLPAEHEQTLQESKIFIMQGMWTYGQPNKVYLTGVLSPCVALIAKYQIPGHAPKTLIAHLDYLTDTRSLITPIKELAGNQNFTPSFLEITLFTTKCDSYEEVRVDYFNHSWKSLHQGKTQAEHVKWTKDQLCTELNMNRSQVKAHIFSINMPLEPQGVYICVAKQLAILSTGKIYMVSHFKSDPFFVKRDFPSIISPLDFFTAEKQKLEPAVNAGCVIRFESCNQEFDSLAYGRVPAINILKYIDLYQQKMEKQ